MEKVPTVPVENFLSNWHELFPDMPLAIGDMERPQAVMAALLHLFDQLGFSRDAVLMVPEDSDENLVYYRDLLPVVNTIRIVNYLVTIMNGANMSISVMHLLQPKKEITHSILLMLFNQMVFNDIRLEVISPSEEELFAHKDKVKSLMEQRDNLIQMRNKEAAEKGIRAERLEQLEHDIPQLEEEVKKVKEIEFEVLQELEAITEENRQTEFLLEQKKAHRDGILAENARKKALKVYDADDIRSQARQAAQAVREGEERLGALSAGLAQKEGALLTLQGLRPALEQACALLHDAARLLEAIKDLESGDLESESAEGELAVLDTERSELEAAAEEARAAAAAVAARRRQRAAALAAAAAAADSALHEAEEKHKRSSEEAERTVSAVRGLKEDAARHAQERAAGEAELAALRERVERALTDMQDKLLNKLKDVCRKVEEQNQRRRKL